jgi:hypothetical protein
LCIYEEDWNVGQDGFYGLAINSFGDLKFSEHWVILGFHCFVVTSQ